MIIGVLLVTSIITVTFGVGYAVGIHLNDGVTKDYLTEIATQTSNKIIHDIRGGLNGVRNAVDDNHKEIILTREYTESMCRAASELIKPTPTTEVDWSGFMLGDDSDFEDCFLDPKPKIYHYQEIRLGNQNEGSLRNAIDSLWQKAYANCTDPIKTKEAYDVLAKIHRQVSAVILKLQRGYKV